MEKKIVVLGLGNILLKDEGIGVHVVQELEKMRLPQNLEVIDGGTAGLAVLSSLQDVDKLIIVDAIKGGSLPGTLYRFRPERVAGNSTKEVLSLHGVGALDVIQHIKKISLALLPEDIIIIGAEPKEIDWGLQVSTQLKEKIPQMIDIIIKEITTKEAVI